MAGHKEFWSKVNEAREKLVELVAAGDRCIRFDIASGSEFVRSPSWFKWFWNAGIDSETLRKARVVLTWNESFFGEPEPHVELLGYLDDGMPVIFAKEDRNTPSAEKALEPVFELFGKEIK